MSDQPYRNLSAETPRIDPRSHLICDQIIECNEVVTARSGELSLPLILHRSLAGMKEKRKKEAKEEEETGHVFGWLSGEIRDRKHLGGEPHYLFGRFIRWSRAPEFRSSTG